MIISLDFGHESVLVQPEYSRVWRVFDGANFILKNPSQSLFERSSSVYLSLGVSFNFLQLVKNSVYLKDDLIQWMAKVMLLRNDDVNKDGLFDAGLSKWKVPPTQRKRLIPVFVVRCEIHARKSTKWRSRQVNIYVKKER